MDLADRLSRLSPEKRALLALRLSGAKGQDSLLLPQILPDPQHRYEPFPLSDIQEAYLIGRSEGVELGNISCHTYFEVDVVDWDHQRFEAALQKMIERHEMLRCIILPDGWQQILQNVPQYRVGSIDLSGSQPAAAAARLEAVRQQMSHKVHPTDRWPLFDFCVSRLDSHRSRLHVSIDLLIADGRSLQVIFGELAQLYRNPAAILPPLDLSFRDYLLALNSLEDTDAYRESREYWLRRLSELPPAPELPLAANPASIARPQFERRHARVDAATWRALKEGAARIGLTPAGTLLAAYAEVLAIWSKNPHFTLNLTLFNRLPFHQQANDIVGDFTSVNLLEVDNSKPEAFEARARRLQEQLWQDLDHRYFSGVRAIRELTRSQGVGPKAIMPVVFTSLLSLGDGNERTPWAGQLGQTAYAVTQTPQVYLDFIAQEDGDALAINWDAVDDLFPPDLLDDLFNGYRRFLDQLASDDSAWRYSLAETTRRLMPATQMELCREVNDTGALLSDELLHTLFLKQVEERPSQTAVCAPACRLTYAEVYRHACRIEEDLLRRRVQPNELVAVMMEKGWEQVVAVLGIHFAGGAYLPIDPDLPAERQRYLIEHGEVKIALTQSAAQNRLSLPAGVDVLAVDLLKPVDAGAPLPRRRQKPEDLAYVIFTSGSTGLPKGVMIDHRGAVNTVLDVNQRFRVGPQDRVLALSRLSFDLSVYDIFGLLAAGGTIVMPSAGLAQDAAHWAQLIVSEKVTVWNTVPALMQLLVEQAAGRAEVIGQSLRLILMSGDWIPVSLPGQIRQILPDAKIMSLGGATEASIWSILYPIERVDPNWKSIPYGKPMLNQSFHVLNQALAPCPAWVPGQLHIGGVGLAKGYWRDKQKSSASFIQHPAAGRLYRTGDLGRYLPDGNIEFLGREDFQVKVQGYRIELGEIEVRLQEHEAVENCAVVVREDNPGEKRLVSYVTVKPGVRLEATDLREYLRAKLPEYMVPSSFVFLDRFPLTSNGKVDRKALPAPTRTTPEAGSSSTAPRDMLELQLINLWEKVLRVHPVRLRDNFFDLGGHSLMAVRLFSELRRLTGRNLALSMLFQAPTVEKLAEILRKDGWSSNWSSLVPIQPGGSNPPFYCVHGAGGNVLLFRDLAHHLGPDYPFYGLQAQGLDGSKNYLRSVEDMAAHYLKEIRELQPEGPYYLGGFCLGGQVAYEIAQRLRKDGQHVALLVMIDTYNFRGVPLRLSFREGVTHVGQKIGFHWVNLMRLGLMEQFAYLGRKIRIASGRELERFFVKLSNLFKIGLSGNGRTPDVFLEQINEEAHFAYRPDVYVEKVTIFKPQRNYAYISDSKMGWGDLAAGGLELIELPVDPGGIFLEPYVQTLAEKLRTRIDEARNSSDALLALST